MLLTQKFTGMKTILSLSLMSLLLLVSLNSFSQKDKSRRPSPPAAVLQKIGAATVSINYSQPSVKSRTIGVDLEPLPGKVWRAGANEATVFETDKDILVEGRVLPKGKYGFFILVQDGKWTFIFNRIWDQWGAFEYKEADDVLRVTAQNSQAEAFSEKLVYKIGTDAKLHVLWGDRDISVQVK